MKFRKKPVVIEAVQWNGNNLAEIESFLGAIKYPIDAMGIIISTLEGNMVASVGDFIIKGINGEFYPCKPEIFEKTYEVVND